MAEDTGMTGAEGATTEGIEGAGNESGTDWETSSGKGGKEQVLADLAAARKEAREAKAIRAKLQEYEDRDKSESQKLTERAEAAEKVASDAQAQLAKYRVAAAAGLDAEEAAYITGSDEAEMKKSAEFLAARFGKGKTPSYDGGSRTSARTGGDMNSLIRRAAGVE